MAKKVVCNCNYNCISHLTKTLNFLWRVDSFIKDAQKDGHKECVTAWQQVKKHAEQDAEMLRKAVESKSKAGKFC